MEIGIDLSNWIKSVNIKNWSDVKKDNLWTGDFKRLEQFHKGDKIVFNVEGTGTFCGIFEVVKETYDEEYQWSDKSIGKQRIDLKPIQLGYADFATLVPKLEFCRGKKFPGVAFLLRNSKTYCANNNKPISDVDLITIENELKNNQSPVEKFLKEEEEQKKKEIDRYNKFESIHEKFVKYIYERSIQEGFSEEDAVFKDFSNRYLNENEIQPKLDIFKNARTILELEKWDDFIKTPGKIIEKLKEICDQQVSKQLISPPRFGNEKSQSRNLYLIKDQQIVEFEKLIFNLFLKSTTQSKFSDNFDSVIKFLKSKKELSVNSQFLAYLAFIVDKEKYIPIRKTEFDSVLEYFQMKKDIKGFSWEKYESYLILIRFLQELLSKKYTTPNTVETHSYLWKISSILNNTTQSKDNGMVNSQQEDDTKYGEFFKILENKNQFIFYGPPGTGKTWKAGNIARAFINQSKVNQFSDKEYENYINNSLQNVADSNSYKLILLGDDKFLIQSADDEIRGKIIFITTGKQDPNRCEANVDDDAINHFSAVEDDKRFIIVVNEETKNFVVIPHKLVLEKFKISGDQTGKQSHRFTINVGREKAEYLYVRDGTENFQDCSQLLHNLEIMFNPNIQPCQFYEKVTFHQTFSYEDFIEGIRPEVSGDKKYITYPVKPGIFKKICSCAKNDENQRYVLLIDEINRGNISKIFGELITLLEKDKRGKDHSIRLPYSKDSFEVPKNLYVIGTMNTADRSLVKLDVALRRRFAFVELMPDPDELVDESIGGFKVREILRTLNQRIQAKSMREYQIGHSYFMPDGKTVKDVSKLQYIFAYEVIPLLKEYFFDNKEKLKAVLNKQFINWDDETLEEKWQKDEQDFIEKLGVFMNESSST